MLSDNEVYFFLSYFIRYFVAIFLLLRYLHSYRKKVDFLTASTMWYESQFHYLFYYHIKIIIFFLSLKCNSSRHREMLLEIWIKCHVNCEYVMARGKIYNTWKYCNSYQVFYLKYILHWFCLFSFYFFNVWDSERMK